MKSKVDVCIIGGGIVGLATARALLQKRPDIHVSILEKEPKSGMHQSTHNSGVLHAGLYYKPGSLKARMAVTGIRMMTDFCRQRGVPHEICGKVVVAVDEVEVGRLRQLHERGTANGLKGLRWLDRDQLREIEPHSAGIAALHVPEEGIVDYRSVCDAMEADILQAGGSFTPNAHVRKIGLHDNEWTVSSDAIELKAGYIINCAGLYSDRIAEAAGTSPSARIVPFRGEYYQLAPYAEKLVRNLIYPVPDPDFPFLGVHFTRMISGGVEAGPNAVLATAREGYSKWDFSAADFAEIVTFKGFWNFLRKHQKMCALETMRSFSKRLFLESLQRLVPEVREEDLVPGGAGVRAQAMDAEGTLVSDFCLEQSAKALHVLNAPSPAATASIAIGEELAAKALPFV